MELSFLLDALKSLLINYTSNNSQIDESLNDLFSSLESKNLNNEIENYAEFVLLASSLFELKAKRMLPQKKKLTGWMTLRKACKNLLSNFFPFFGLTAF